MLTQSEIQRVRAALAAGTGIREISRSLGFARSTVRKIARRKYGYEGISFDKRRYVNVGGIYTAPVFTSPVDGERLHVESGSEEGYRRISKNGKRLSIHIYEARKVYTRTQLEWPPKAVVHHIDYNENNYAPSNLSVFENRSLHCLHHGELSKAMYEFLSEEGFLPQFYERHPSLKLVTLVDLLHKTAHVGLENCDGFEAKLRKR